MYYGLYIQCTELAFLIQHFLELQEILSIERWPPDRPVTLFIKEVDGGTFTRQEDRYLATFDGVVMIMAAIFRHYFLPLLENIWSSDGR